MYKKEKCHEEEENKRKRIMEKFEANGEKVWRKELDRKKEEKVVNIKSRRKWKRNVQKI